MLDEAKLRLLFRARLQTVGTLPAAQYLSWENRNFLPPEPDADQPWVREHVTLLSEQKSASSQIEAVGTVQYSVHVAAGRGTAAGDALAKAIAEAFEAGQSLTDGTTVAIIERTERAPYRSGSEGSVWVFKTVTARWRVFTQTST